MNWSFAPTKVIIFPPRALKASSGPNVSVTSAMLREPASATCGYESPLPPRLTVFHLVDGGAKLGSIRFHSNWVTPSVKGVGPSRMEKSLPRSSPNQMRLPCLLRGPSHILSTAVASAAVRQFGAAGAPGCPQMFALALKRQVRGSLMMPSVTPSFASQVAIADFCTATSLAGGMAPLGVSPASSNMAICPHIWAVWKRVQYMAGALARMPSSWLPSSWASRYP